MDNQNSLENKNQAVGLGFTVLEAQENACEILGVSTADVEFEIIQLPEKKKLGLFGGKQAKVVARIKDSTSNIGKEYLQAILDGICSEKIEIESQVSENNFNFKLTGPGVKDVLDQRIEVLEAIRYLTSLAISQNSEQFAKVKIEAEGLEEKKENDIKEQVNKAISRVKKTRSKVILKHMNSYERRLVHQVVDSISGVSSWSEGEGKDRHVVIGLA